LEVDAMDLDEHTHEFERKAVNKGQKPELFSKKFNAKENTYSRDWHNSLKPQIRDLPDFKDVVRH